MFSSLETCSGMPWKGNRKIRSAPDALTAFGRPKGYRGSYKQWEEGDVAPQVTEPGGFLQLAAGLLQAQVENLLAQVAAPGGQFLRVQIFDFRHFHSSFSPGNDGK